MSVKIQYFMESDEGLIRIYYEYSQRSQACHSGLEHIDGSDQTHVATLHRSKVESSEDVENITSCDKCHVQ